MLAQVYRRVVFIGIYVIFARLEAKESRFCRYLPGFEFRRAPGGVSGVSEGGSFLSGFTTFSVGWGLGWRQE